MQVLERLKKSDTFSWPTEWETLTPQELLRQVFAHFGSQVALCTSFQSTGMVILDMAWRLYPQLRVFTIDTGRLPQETYDLMERVQERYGIHLEVYFPEATNVEQLVRQHGVNLFYRTPDLRILCCRVRKVHPLQRALSSLNAWITGLRREQNSTRTQVRKLEIDHEHGGIIKINPLADWTDQDTWNYLRTHNVPYHDFYDRGYTSIGCAPCTRPTALGEDQRAGRWWWETDTPKECGLHYVMNADGQIECKARR